MEKDEEVGSYFCSQPVAKKSNWTEDLWRRMKRPSSSTKAGPSTEIPTEKPPENDPEKGSAIVSNKDSKNWSPDVLEFYLNGDSPYCYSRFITKKLDRSFWGALLGNESGGHLSSTHVEAWTVRLMRVRQAMLLKNPNKELRWSVLPPGFYDYMQDDKSTTPLYYAGQKDPYPPFWEVDCIYLPLWIRQKDWLLVRIDMQSMVITQYWTDKRWRNGKHRDVRNYMELLQIFFKWFLERIHFRRHTRYITEREMSLGLVETDVPQDEGNIANAGVLVCMMMEKLVKNKPLKIHHENTVEEACVNYRRHMADELYKCRCDKFW